jgi:hypothetical protein
MDRKFGIAEVNAIVVPDIITTVFHLTQNAKFGNVLKLYILSSLRTSVR